MSAISQQSGPTLATTTDILTIASNNRHITTQTDLTTGPTQLDQQCNRKMKHGTDKEERIKIPRFAFLKISVNAHLAHLQSRSSQSATQILQESQIFHPSGFPIFTSVL